MVARLLHLSWAGGYGRVRCTASWRGFGGNGCHVQQHQAEVLDASDQSEQDGLVDHAGPQMGAAVVYADLDVVELHLDQLAGSATDGDLVDACSVGHTPTPVLVAARIAWW